MPALRMLRTYTGTGPRSASSRTIGKPANGDRPEDVFAGLFDGFDVNGGKPGAAVAGRDGQPCKFYSPSL